LLLYFSFFSRDRNPLHLHSFPTRRSSDLPNCGYTLPKLDLAATSIKLAPDGEGPTHVKIRTPQGEIELDIPLPGVHNVYNATARSEEHTSELQSQSNLVCRLLLEKKKKKE